MTCFELGFNHLANRHQAFVGMGAKLFDVISFIARGDRQNKLHLTLITPLGGEFVQQLQQACLRHGVRFDTLHELENGSETAWRNSCCQSVIFFGFGGLNLQQLNKVLIFIEQQLENLKLNGVAK